MHEDTSSWKIWTNPAILMFKVLLSKKKVYRIKGLATSIKPFIYKEPTVKWNENGAVEL